jgi:predicted nucleotidyltransferase
MNGMAIRPQDLAIVAAILRAALPADARAWMFGTRARGSPRRASDLDIAVDAGRPLSRAESAALNEAFAESDLPYTVDVVDWRAVDPGFREVIEHDLVALEFAASATAGG